MVSYIESVLQYCAEVLCRPSVLYWAIVSIWCEHLYSSAEAAFCHLFK